ncbi:MAG: agmatinase [Planctomycetota bacterium]|jgi:agmatinase
MAKTINFGDLPESYCTLSTAKAVIVPVPYDGTSTWLKGADKGPGAIIEASANMELYDIETDCEVYKQGVFTDESLPAESSPEKMVEAVRSKVEAYIKKNKFVVVLGGEHSVSVGAVLAHCGGDGDISVLQLDAHSDLRDEYDGSKYNHACVMARVRELAPIVQVGVRSMDSCEKEFINSQNTFFAKDICGGQGWIDSVLERLSDKVYITIDLDVFDISIMPFVGTPEPGGLLWYDVLALLRTVFEKRQVAGFDVVELCPNEHSKASDFLAAKLIYKLLSYKFAR